MQWKGLFCGALHITPVLINIIHQRDHILHGPRVVKPGKTRLYSVLHFLNPVSHHEFE